MSIIPKFPYFLKTCFLPESIVVCSCNTVVDIVFRSDKCVRTSSEPLDSTVVDMFFLSDKFICTSSEPFDSNVVDMNFQSDKSVCTSPEPSDSTVFDIIFLPDKSFCPSPEPSNSKSSSSLTVLVVIDNVAPTGEAVRVDNERLKILVE